MALREKCEEEKDAFISLTKDENRELRREIERLAPMNDKEKIEAYRKRYAFFRFRMFSTIKKLV